MISIGGRLTIIPLVNQQGARQSRRHVPLATTDLNRVFPGRADGTLSERIAHAITTEVIAEADLLVDLHAGDGNEALRPYVYVPVTGDARLDAAIRGMALAFGLDHIVIDAGRIAPADATKYVDQTALARGIPAITTETGQLGQNDERWVALAEHGVWNLLRHLGMRRPSRAGPGRSFKTSRS